MDLGAFSVSLTVSDLAASLGFYETLGFETVGGKAEDGWLMLRNGDAMIGLFHGMFESNILTFNPGLGQDMSQPKDFTDVREIQASLQAAGIEPRELVDPDSIGPGHLIVTDPDGNVILIDQFG